MKEPCDKCGVMTNLNASGLCSFCRTKEFCICGDKFTQVRVMAEIKDVCRKCYNKRKCQIEKKKKRGDMEL